MPTILHKQNEFDSSDGVTKTIVEEGSTPRQYVDRVHGGEFKFATLLEVNGVEVMRADWDSIRLSESDVVEFKQLAMGEVGEFIGGIVAAVFSLFIDTDVPEYGDRDEAPSVFNLSGQKNSVKLGQPIQIPYGRPLNYAPYAAVSYNRFDDQTNTEILYQIFCQGPGEYDNEQFRFEDTVTWRYQNVTVQEVAPGGSITLFDDNVVTSPEVVSVEMHGPNEADYAGEIGPFIVNPSGTTTTQLEWDLIVQNGLYERAVDGAVEEATVELDFSYREVDDDGVAVGAGTWTVVPFSWTLGTVETHRFTVYEAVAAGRYEVKAVRTNNAFTTVSSQDAIHWHQLRAVLPSPTSYGDVTLIAVQATATNNLNSKTENKFNMIGTRKLPIWNGTTWSAPTATRNPVWAYVDILKSTYGGAIDDSRIDLTGLLTLATTYDTAGWDFDWIFDRTTTVYEALKTVATACRSKAVVQGGKFTLVYDTAISAGVTAFGPEKMKSGSFSLTGSLQKAGEFDGLTLSYTDETTWREETVDCLFGSDAGLRTEKKVMPGIINRDKAYQMGMYMRTKKVLQTQAMSFDTGREGRNVVFGDRVDVSHDIAWGQSGLVDSIAGDNVTVTLVEPLKDFAGDRVAFVDKDGAIDGPYVCTVDASNPYEIVSAATIAGSFLFNDVDEPPMYFFGTASTLFKPFLVTEKKSSSDGDTESLSLVNYDERLYQYDSYTAPPL